VEAHVEIWKLLRTAQTMQAGVGGGAGRNVTTNGSLPQVVNSFRVTRRRAKMKFGPLGKVQGVQGSLAEGRTRVELAESNGGVWGS